MIKFITFTLRKNGFRKKVSDYYINEIAVRN